MCSSDLALPSSQGTGDGLWRFEDGKAVEILKGSDEGLFEPPAVSADGRQLAVILRRDGKLRLHVLSADGGDLQSLAEPIDIRGSVCWSPDGRWIIAGGIDDRHLRVEVFFEKTLERQWTTFKLVRAPREKKLPVILSRKEVGKILGLVRLPVLP